MWWFLDGSRTIVKVQLRMPFLARELVGWQKCLKEFLIPHSNVERDHNDSNSVLLDCTLMTFSSLLASTQKRLADIHVICPVSFGGLQTHHRLFPNDTREGERPPTIAERETELAALQSAFDE